MSAAAACLLLGALVALLIRTKAVKIPGAVACVVFGIVLASSPVGPAVTQTVGQVGTWAYTQLRAV